MIESITPFLIISAKSIAVYLFILIAFRLLGKKELAQLSVFDLVFILLISNSVQNAMVGEDVSLIGGFAAAGGLFIFNYLFSFLTRKFPIFNSFVQGDAIMLVHKGKIIKPNLVKSMITTDELESAIREHGVKSIEEVDLAILEVDGNISVLSNNFSNHSHHQRKPRNIMD